MEEIRKRAGLISPAFNHLPQQQQTGLCALYGHNKTSLDSYYSHCRISAPTNTLPSTTLMLSIFCLLYRLKPGLQRGCMADTAQVMRASKAKG